MFLEKLIFDCFEVNIIPDGLFGFLSDVKKHKTTIKKWIFHVRSDWCLCIQDCDIQYLSGWMWKVVGELVKVWQGLRDIFHRSAISGTSGKIATASCPTLLGLVMDCHIFLVGWLYIYIFVLAEGGWVDDYSWLILKKNRGNLDKSFTCDLYLIIWKKVKYLVPSQCCSACAEV